MYPGAIAVRDLERNEHSRSSGSLISRGWMVPDGQAAPAGAVVVAVLACVCGDQQPTFQLVGFQGHSRAQAPSPPPPSPKTAPCVICSQGGDVRTPCGAAA